MSYSEILAFLDDVYDRIHNNYNNEMASRETGQSQKRQGVVNNVSAPSAMTSQASRELRIIKQANPDLQVKPTVPATFSCPVGTTSTYNNKLKLISMGYKESLAQNLAKIDTCVLNPCQWDTPLSDSSSIDKLSRAPQAQPSYEGHNQWVPGKGCACAADRGWLGVIASRVPQGDQNTGVAATLYGSRCVQIASCTKPMATSDDNSANLELNDMPSPVLSRSIALESIPESRSNVLTETKLCAQNAIGLGGFAVAYQKVTSEEASGTEFLHTYPMKTATHRIKRHLLPLKSDILGTSRSEDDLNRGYVSVQESHATTTKNASWFNRTLLGIDYELPSSAIHNFENRDKAKRLPVRYARLWRSRVSPGGPVYSRRCRAPKGPCPSFIMGARYARVSLKYCFEATAAPCMITNKWENEGKGRFEDVPVYSDSDSSSVRSGFPLCSQVAHDAVDNSAFEQSESTDTKMLLEDTLRQIPKHNPPEGWFNNEDAIIRRVSQQTLLCHQSNTTEKGVTASLYEKALVPSPFSARTRAVAGVRWDYRLPVDASTAPGMLISIEPLKPTNPNLLSNIPFE